MDTLCGVGLPEFLILAIIGFVLIGPERTRQVAYQAGKWMRSPLYNEIASIVQQIRSLPDTLVRMSEEIDELAQQQIQTIEKLGDYDPIQGDAIPTDSTTDDDSDDDPWGTERMRADRAPTRSVENAVSQTQYPEDFADDVSDEDPQQKPPPDEDAD